MDSKKEVSHTGIVNEINPKGIKVGIIVKSGCVSCQIKSACSMSEQKEKILDIECNPFNFNVGQEVIVSLKATQGINALLLGYFLPFLVLMTTMFIASALTKNEGIVGIVSIGSIIPYYFVLYLFRYKIKKKFTYVVNPLNN